MVRWGWYTLMVWLVHSASGCSPEGVADVTIGETTYLCLISNNENFTVFQPQADQYSRFTIPGSFAANKGGCQGDQYYLETMGVSIPFSKAFCRTQGSERFFFPILTAIISVEQGKVQGVSWDDGCYFTDSSAPATIQQCLGNAFNSSTRAEISTNVPAPSEGKDTGITLSACEDQGSDFCDLTFYVGWTGTDSNGNYFGSAGRRFSVFRQYAMAFQYDAMQVFLS